MLKNKLINNKKTILVVEDDKSLNKIIILKLKEAGFQTISVEDAESAFKFLDGNKPDLIWLDIYLPGMNGLEFLRAIRNHPNLKDMKVVIVSVSGSNKKIQEAKQLKALDYFVKSNYKIEELVEKVGAFLAP